MIEMRPPTQQELAQRLRQARESAGMTQEDVAHRLDLSRSSVAQIELGKRAVSGLELDRLARLYGRDIRDFFAVDLRPEESVIALFRAASVVTGREGVLDALRDCVVLARELAGLEGVLGIDRSQSAVPVYPHGPLRARWQAIEQGTRAAVEERRRLGLGARPLGDLSELLEEQGIRTVMIDLPDEVSGLSLMEKGLSLSAIVNQRHSRLRRRFSWAHEYAHLLLDRDRQGTISLASDRDELAEIRANVFAASFLMPEEGVREFLADLGKGRPRRERVEIFDEEAVIPAEIRTEPDAQAVRLYDVVLLAHHFKVSRTSMLYRLHNLRFLSQAALDPLLREEESGRGRDIERLLDLPQIDHAAGRNSFRSRFLGLAIEACRRDAITLAKLRELAALVGFSEREILDLLEDAGLSPDEGAEVLLPDDPRPTV
jgi:Zn-dependent peptidase ImmA (M78 family)/DNA-binding XRE family transcriptional regulator